MDTITTSIGTHDIGKEINFKRIVENYPDHIIILDNNLKIIYVNRPSEGFTLKDLIGIPLYNFVHKEKQHEVKQILESVLQSGDPRTYETEYHIKNTLIYYESRAVPRIENSQIIGLTVSSRDITRSKAIIEKAPVGIFIADKIGKFTEFNKLAYEMLGYTSNDIKDLSIQDLVHPDEIERTKEIFAKLFSGQKIVEDFKLRQKSGDYIDIELSAIMLSDGRILGYSTDITKHKGLERQVIESEERYRTLFEDSPVPICVHAEGIVRILNRAAIEAFGGKTESELIGTPIIERVHPEYRNIVMKRVNKIYKKSIDRAVALEEKFIKLDGTPIDVLVSGSMVNFKGKPASQVVFYDITELKKLQEQILQSSKMDAVGRLASGIAHDFNNILTGILGYTELLQQEINKEDENYEYLVEIENASLRASKLTNQLLTFSKKQVYNQVTVDLNKILLKNQNFLRRIIRDDIEMRIDVHPEKVLINADPNKIEQMMMNLVVNSNESISGFGKILISIDIIKLEEPLETRYDLIEINNYAKITVIDNGTGMNEEVLSHLFEPYYTTKQDNTGLGLSICYNVIKQSNGYIDVLSEIGKGTTIIIYLPLNAKINEIIENDDDATNVNVQTKEAILIVDDDLIVLKVTKKMLEINGYNVISTNDPNIAPTLFKKENIGLLLTDIVMPIKSGIELYNELIKLKTNLRVLFISGHPGDYLTKHGHKIEGYNFLSKPFSINQLISKIKEILNN